MNVLLRPLRLRLAVVGFAAIYIPVLALLSVVFLVSEEEIVSSPLQPDVLETTRTLSPLVFATAAVLAPVAALLAWWWSARAVRPVENAIGIQQQLIEEASHELRTPLSILSTNADVLLAHPEPTLELYRRGLERTGAVVQRMTATIDSLLVDARGRARTIDRQPTDVVLLSRAAVDVLKPLASSRHVKLALLSPQRPVRAPVDPSSIERAITNLLTNAIQHAPTTSTVEILVAAAEAAVEIVVTDHGPGIAVEDQTKIFDRYWQGDPGDGAGIGLAIVRQIAVAHGGSVTVTSPIDGNVGTQFCLRLPV